MSIRIHIVECIEVDERVLEAITRLIRQLSSSSKPPTSDELKEIVASPSTILFLAIRYPDVKKESNIKNSHKKLHSTTATLQANSKLHSDGSTSSSDSTSKPISTSKHCKSDANNKSSHTGYNRTDYDSTDIVGVLTLVVFRIPTGICSRIEDVVVEKSVRGMRIGERLCIAGMKKARSLGATSTDLTSRPSRAAANRLYQRMGFTQRNTNVYRFKL